VAVRKRPELPASTIYKSGIEVGDQLLICSSEKMQDYWASPSETAGNESQAEQSKAASV